MESFAFKVDNSGKRLDLFLSETLQKTRSHMKSEIEAGSVCVNGLPAKKPGLKLRLGDEIIARFRPEQAPTLTPVSQELSVLFEDEDVIVINKEPGWVVHPASSHSGDTVVHFLLHYLKNESRFQATSHTRPGIVHRLDRGTSGVLAVAKHRVALERLSRSFKDREVKKEYEAIVWGKRLGEGKVESAIIRHPLDRKRMTSKKGKGRDAMTEWRAETVFSHFTHVRLFPHTGRTHQLRVHLSDTGNPIVGDGLYGGRKKVLLPSELLTHAVSSMKLPLLHARKLEFPHPTTGERISVEASRSPDFDKLLSLMKGLDR